MNMQLDSPLLAPTHTLADNIRRDDSRDASIARGHSGGKLTKLTRHRTPSTTSLMALALKKTL
ncbi:hypothetical protein GGR74_001249 [Xanthomonas arboricola]|nr:hypothetical protein [Xanthomonas euroxanthea]